MGVRLLDRPEGDKLQASVTFVGLDRERCDHGGNSDREYGWFDFRSMVGKEGWSGATLRFFERVSQPRVEFSRDSFGRSYPVEQSWDNLPLRRLIDAKVRVLDRHNEKLDIHEEQLATVIAVVRSSLIAAASLLDEIGNLWWDMPTPHQNGR